MLVAASTLVQNKVWVQLPQCSRGEGFPQTREEEAGEVEMAQPAHDVRHDEDAQPGRIASQAKVGLVFAERDGQPRLEHVELGLELGQLARQQGQRVCRGRRCRFRGAL